MNRLVEGIKDDYSLIFLIIANLIPIFGIIFWGWTIFSVLIFYWLESAVMGIYNIPKMLLARSYPPGLEMPQNQKIVSTVIMKFFFPPFFIFHYGGFMVGHLLFIFAISSMAGGFENTTFDILRREVYSIFYAAIFIFVSHGISFFINFIGKEEYKKESVAQLMTAPYKRIVVMHLTLLFGGFISTLLYTNSGSRGASLGIISLFIFLKIYLDIKAHNKEHSETFIKPFLSRGK